MSKYKVYLDPGHGGRDPGAVKYIREADVNLTTALACRDCLKANGVDVKMSRTADKNTDIASMCQTANAWGADLAVSIHNNAGGGDGFEVYHSVNGGKGKALAANIEAEVKKIGQNSRGLKTRKGANGDYYGFIRLTAMPAVICEGCFVDNKTDSKIADTKAEQKKFGCAYARGILKTLGLKDNGLTGKAATTAEKTASAAAKTKTSSYAKKIKKYLKAAGYFDGAVDNKVTDEYTKAIKTIQNKYFKRAADRDGKDGPNTLILAECIYNMRGVKYFDLEEFRCSCGHCTGYPAVLNRQLLLNMDHLRKNNGAIAVTSGLRCKRFNSRLPGAVSGSLHLSGRAVDFYNAKLTGTKAKRAATVKRWYGYKKANYAYANTPGMGNAVHVDVKK